jgi:hypothetical protein
MSNYLSYFMVFNYNSGSQHKKKKNNHHDILENIPVKLFIGNDHLNT